MTASSSSDDGSSRRADVGLNAETFVPFAVVAREPVSRTAFVLTLRPPAAATPDARAATRDAVARAWRHGLWSVEVRQPQLQIARDYTPLPAVAPAGGGDDSEIRLLVRAVPGGEVSRYLATRAVVGASVDVRGPRLGFDVAARMGGNGGSRGSQQQLVVLAGGTGVATALQAAAAVAPKSPRVAILWANRLADDSEGLGGDDSSAPANTIVRELKALQQRLGADRVRILNYVDAQGTFIDETAVRRAVEGAAARSWRPWRARPRPTIPLAASSRCRYHSAAALQTLAADAPREAGACTCPQGTGTSLLLVSGPDGFVAAWAGAKTWAGGQERQGPVGGILGRLPLADWQVLKL